MLRTFTLARGDMHYGPHTWDDETGIVTGIQAASLHRMGAEPWSHPSGIGTGTGHLIALRSNDGFIAMLMMLGYEMPPELEVENPPEPDDDVPGDRPIY